MKNRFILILLAFLFFVSNLAFAAPPQNYGSYLCSDCGVSESPPDLPNVYVFIRSTQITTQWSIGDVVTICDGTSCLQVKWFGTTWLPTGPAYKDPKLPYKNGTSAYLVPGSSNEYYVTIIWISPNTGQLLQGTVTIIDPNGTPVGSNASGTGAWGTYSIGRYEPGGDNLDNDPIDGGDGGGDGC